MTSLGEQRYLTPLAYKYDLSIRSGLVSFERILDIFQERCSLESLSINFLLVSYISRSIDIEHIIKFRVVTKFCEFYLKKELLLSLKCFVLKCFDNLPTILTGTVFISLVLYFRKFIQTNPHRAS